jgi:hypothetical protein
MLEYHRSADVQMFRLMRLSELFHGTQLTPQNGLKQGLARLLSGTRIIQ